MNMERIGRRSLLPFAIAAFALALGGAWSSAHAATGHDAAACGKLPASQRGICTQEAGFGQHNMQKSLTPAQKQALARENARYKKASDACKHLPGSQRTTCMSRAGDDAMLAAAR
ncbi:MAG TPA: hypothetical protein VGI14_19385 [Casimicrobiaceae bacterium]